MASSAFPEPISGIKESLLDATGDILYASADNTPVRLGIGSSAQVLTVAGGVPSWATPTGGASYTAWTSYTPTWGSVGTSFSLGNGTSTGAYTRVGDLVYVRTKLVWGSTTSLVGSYYMLTSFPSGLTNRESNSGIPFVGFTWYYDVSTAAEARGPITQHSSTQARLYYWKSDTTNLSVGGFTETTPWVPATGDEINAWFIYPTDAA
jgi:hypothetical protein